MLRVLSFALFAGTALLCRAQAPAPGQPAAPARSDLDIPAPARPALGAGAALSPAAALKGAPVPGLAAPAAATVHPTAAPLSGQIEDNVYTSPTGAFQIDSPVLPELGGTVNDNGNVVTFQDDVSTVISIATFPMNAGERWKLQLDGPKQYLLKFFDQYVLPDFARAFPGVTVDKDATFMPHLLDGALLVYAELPGGSMFANKVVIFDPARKLPPAKRGNLVFLHNGYVFVISTELAERILEGTAYTMTPEEENLELKERLEDTVNRMKFLRQAPQ
ncbi:MAG TPA: hypothetical protein VHC86_03800 [Opitutaceae bacterium]|nr:hypothetical protein [Opitutaceae bacterium]